MSQEIQEKISRKDFLKMILGAGAAMGLGSIIGPLVSNKISAPSVKHDPSTAQMNYLSKLWWIWQCSIPADISPVYDLTGTKAFMGNLHNEKDVFFLAEGYQGPTPAGPEGETPPLRPGIIRRAKIKADGKSLFMPMVNSIFFVGLNGTPEEAMKKANANTDSTYETTLKLGSNLTAKRIEKVIATPFDRFTIEFADRPTYSEFKPNQRVEAFTSGIWCLTNPLKRGETYDVTYGSKVRASAIAGGSGAWETEYRYILEVV
jgi:hypothetical protein